MQTSPACREPWIWPSSPPPEIVALLISELSQRGTRASVVITTGFGGSGELGRALPQAMLEAAKPNLLRIVGPSCVGIMLPRLGLDATFSHIAGPCCTDRSLAGKEWTVYLGPRS